VARRDRAYSSRVSRDLPAPPRPCTATALTGSPAKGRAAKWAYSFAMSSSRPRNDYPRNDYPRNDYPRNDYPRNDYPRNEFPLLAPPVLAFLWPAG